MVGASIIEPQFGDAASDLRLNASQPKTPAYKIVAISVFNILSNKNSSGAPTPQHNPAIQMASKPLPVVCKVPIKERKAK